MRCELRILLSIVLCVTAEVAFAGPDSPQKESPPKRLLPHPDDIKPLPLVAFPDNPPPHEGAMIEVPEIIGSPDLVEVEVLEALAGQPITSERLVKQDGYVSLGFYGDVFISGLSPMQAKEKIVLHLRKFLPDEVLGLTKYVDEASRKRNPLERDPLLDVPPLPPDSVPPIPKQSRTQPRPEVIRRAGRVQPVLALQGGEDRREERGRQPHHVPAQEKAQRSAAPVAPPPTGVTVNSPSGVKISIEVNPTAPETPPFEGEMPEDTPTTANTMDVEPKNSDRVFVDITGYNSTAYWVLGDLQAPGRIAWFANVTVLDALNYAGGLIASGDPRDIRLVRPARGDKPAHVFRIDYEAIVDRGDKTANLQILPGDRLVVGRRTNLRTSDVGQERPANADVARNEVQR